MTDNIIKNSIFNEEDLDFIPLTYRFMILEKTANIGELHSDREFVPSQKHQSKQCMIYVNYKPISNFLPPYYER